VRGADGKIAPHLMVWPAFWALVSAEGVQRFEPEQLGTLVDEVLPEREAQGGEEGYAYPSLTAEQIAAVLVRLEEGLGDGKEAVYVRRGVAYRLTEVGEIEIFERDGWPADSAYTWPLGHDVRPAAQSLGVGGCLDCHAGDAAFTFGSISPETAAQLERPPLEFMFELRGESRLLSSIWASSFAQRFWFKFVCFACVVVLGAVLYVYGLAAFAAGLRQFR